MMMLNMRMVMIIMVMSRMVMIIMLLRLIMMIQVQVYGRDVVNAAGVEAGSEKVGMYEHFGGKKQFTDYLQKNIESLLCFKMLNVLQSMSVEPGGRWIWREQTRSRILPDETLVAIYFVKFLTRCTF